MKDYQKAINELPKLWENETASKKSKEKMLNWVDRNYLTIIFALNAMAKLEDSGFVVAPKVPTDAMYQAGMNTLAHCAEIGLNGTAAHAYVAMIEERHTL
jgi:hypothetical protein